MIAREAQSWQLLLADLSLILFIVTAAGLAAQDQGGAAQISAPPEPVAYYRGTGSGDALAQWLAAYEADPRERLTILIRYAPGQIDAALTRAQVLSAQTKGARISLEEGQGNEVLASFAFEGETTLARSLLNRTDS